MWKIDISKVPQDKRTEQRFLEFQSDFLKDLCNEGWLHAFCVHEAAHIVLFATAGRTQPAIVGPRICYNEKIEDFEAFPVTVEFKDHDPEIVNRLRKTGQTIYAWARGYAAGGVAAIKIVGASDGGDEVDFQLLQRMCDMDAQSNPSEPPLNPLAVWKRAQAEVEVYISNPNVRRSILDLSARIRETLSRNFENCAPPCVEEI